MASLWAAFNHPLSGSPGPTTALAGLEDGGYGISDCSGGTQLLLGAGVLASDMAPTSQDDPSYLHHVGFLALPSLARFFYSCTL